MYIRYHKESLEFWGTTTELHDDPECEYVLDSDYPLPVIDIFSEKIIWNGAGWTVISRGE
jgi:hypothetical protein